PSCPGKRRRHIPAKFPPSKFPPFLAPTNGTSEHPLLRACDGRRPGSSGPDEPLERRLLTGKLLRAGRGPSRRRRTCPGRRTRGSSSPRTVVAVCPTTAASGRGLLLAQAPSGRGRDTLSRAGRQGAPVLPTWMRSSARLVMAHPRRDLRVPPLRCRE